MRTESIKKFVQDLNRASDLKLYFANGVSVRITSPYFVKVCKYDGQLVFSTKDCRLALGRLEDAELTDSEECEDIYTLVMADGNVLELCVFGNATLGARLATGLFDNPGALEAAEEWY